MATIAEAECLWNSKNWSGNYDKKKEEDRNKHKMNIATRINGKWFCKLL